MANPSWLNDNRFRDYPFVPRVMPLDENPGITSSSSLLESLPLPHSAIVDFGAIMEIDALFDELAGHFVYLHSISRQSDLFTFRLRTNAPGAANHELVFTRNLTDAEFLIEWEDASTIDPETPEPLECPIQPKWHGFLVSSSMEELAAVISSGETLTAVAGMWQIEPARIQSLARSYLRTVSLANTPRLHATPPEGCSDSSSDYGEQIAIINAQCMVGNLKWREGYNTSIRQDTNNNAIVIGAGRGLGEGEPCEEIPLYPEEEPPDDSRFLSGGPACNEIVKSINGVSGTDINLIAGPGFRIQPDTVSPNKLIINRSMDDFAICEEDLISSVSSSEQAVPCDAFTPMDVFNIEIAAGILTGRTVTCVYDPSMSFEGEKSWVSAFNLERTWVNGAFCSYRWRAKVSCETGGLRVSVVGYPLADNTPCITCAALMAHPVSQPVAGNLEMLLTRNTAGCGCVEINLATRVLVSQ